VFEKKSNRHVDQQTLLLKHNAIVTVAFSVSNRPQKYKVLSSISL